MLVAEREPNSTSGRVSRFRGSVRSQVSVSQLDYCWRGERDYGGKWVTIGQFARAETVVRVRLEQTWQVDSWAREFGCTPYELREAVRTVGTEVANVRAYLKRKGWHKLAADGSVCFASPFHWTYGDPAQGRTTIVRERANLPE